MFTKIVKNEERKTVTVIVSPIVIAYTDYLFEKYNGERYFASGVLKDADLQKDIYPFLKDLLSVLNEVAKDVLPQGEKFVGSDLLTLKEDEYRLISKNIDKEGKWDKQFKFNLTNKSNDKDKKFLFLDLKGEKPIDKKDGWKHFYAIEIEISVGYNEDELEKYIYTVFHRAISVGARGSSTFQQNDEAWGGFNFGDVVDDTKEQDDFYESSKQLTSEEDLPF